MNSLHQLLHWQFVLSVLSIVVVDLTLSGDNAVVIAAAAKSLPRSMRNRALIAGAACAVVALVVAASFATRLLHVKFLQVIGGTAILWIAVGLFREEPPLESSAMHLASFWKAMWFIVVADVTMSTDNILAVAAIAQGNFVLLLLGLSLSIPLVVFASGMLTTLMDNYPVIVYGGAAGSWRRNWRSHRRTMAQDSLRPTLCQSFAVNHEADARHPLRREWSQAQYTNVPRLR